MSTRRTRNRNLCQLAVRERLAKYVKYKASSFLIFIFFLDSPTEVTRGWILTQNGSKHMLSREEVPFWGPRHGRQRVWVQISPKLSKMAFYRQVQASANGLKINDIIWDWRHWVTPSLAHWQMHGLPWLVKQRILFIAYWESLLCIFQWLSTIQRKYQHSAYALYFGTEIRFWKSLYSICRQSVVQGVS